MTSDPFSLEGRRALVTGGNRGIGFAIVGALARAGARVAFVSRDASRNEDAVRRLKDDGLVAHALEDDITQPDAPARIVDEAVTLLGGLDVLVNDAGTGHHTAATDITPAEWDEVFNLNVKAMFRMSQEARSELARRRGNIVNVGSMSGFIVNRPQPQTHYNASKAAVHHLTKSLAVEWAADGIRVNAIAPGYVKTELAPVDRPDLRQHWIEDAPLKRYAMPEEIAPSVVYLASSAAAFVTGAILVIDGGYTLY